MLPFRIACVRAERFSLSADRKYNLHALVFSWEGRGVPDAARLYTEVV